MKNFQIKKKYLIRNNKLFFLNEFYKKILRFIRFLKFNFYIRQDNMYFKLFFKPCPIKNRHFYRKIVKKIKHIKKKLKKIRSKKKIRIHKKKLKMNKKNYYYLRKMSFSRYKCRFHTVKKTHCLFFSSLKIKRNLIKLVISKLFSKKISNIRLSLKKYKSRVTTAYIQCLKIKEFIQHSRFPVRKFKQLNTRAINKVLRFTTKLGATGCTIRLKGVYKSKRTRTMKFRKGLLKFSGGDSHSYNDCYKFNLLKKRGSLGIKLKIAFSNKILKKKFKDLFLPGKIGKLKKFKFISKSIT